MVDEQLRRRNVTDERVLEVMGRVPRHRFVGTALLDEAYRDHPLPIGQCQTISQPYMVARMTELCQPTPRCRVLEVGAGGGYQTAVLASLCERVYAVEYIQSLAEVCRRNLAQLGIANVTIKQGDRPPTHFHQFDHQGIGNGRFSGSRKSCEKHCKALFVTRGS